METPKFSIKRLATATGLQTVDIKHLLGIPIKTVCKAKTFKSALAVFTEAKDNSDTELAAYRKMTELLPGRLSTVETTRQAKALYEMIAEIGDIKIVLSVVKHWLGLTTTLNETVAVLVAEIPDVNLIKDIFAKMCTQLKTANRPGILRALSTIKKHDGFALGIVFAPKETTEFLTEVAGIYTKAEVSNN